MEYLKISSWQKMSHQVFTCGIILFQEMWFIRGYSNDAVIKEIQPNTNIISWSYRFCIYFFIMTAVLSSCTPRFFSMDLFHSTQLFLCPFQLCFENSSPLAFVTLVHPCLLVLQCYSLVQIVFLKKIGPRN